MKIRNFPSVGLAALTLLSGALAPRALRGDDSSSSANQDRVSSLLPFPLSSVVGDDYQLQPYDLVVFEMIDEPDLETQQRVSGRGDMRLPMLGSVQLKGLSVRGAEEELESLYKVRGYFRHPQIILYVAQHSERMISVIGQVNRPDRIEIPVGTDDLGLAQAIAMTGGLTRIAKASGIQISRIGVDGKEQRFVVNLDAYLKAERSAPVSDFRLQPGDVVFVPERTI